MKVQFPDSHTTCRVWGQDYENLMVEEVRRIKVSMGLWVAAVSLVFPFLTTPGLQG